MRAREVVITIYLFLLISSSLYFHKNIPVVSTVANWSYQTLAKVSIIPGLALFRRLGPEPWKNRGNCIDVKFDDGLKLTPLRRFDDMCDPPPVRWIANNENVLFFRLLEDAAYDHVLVNRRAKEIDPNRRPYASKREQSLLLAFGDYFCHSELVGRDHATASRKTVSMLWEQKRIHYERGETKTVPIGLIKWNCEPFQIQSVEWFPAANAPNVTAFRESRMF